MSRQYWSLSYFLFTSNVSDNKNIFRCFDRDMVEVYIENLLETTTVWMKSLITNYISTFNSLNIMNTILWVSIMFLSNVFFFLILSFSFHIFCNRIIVIVAVKLCFLIFWWSVRLFHYWNPWTPFKNWVSLGHLWLLFPIIQVIHHMHYLFINW